MRGISCSSSIKFPNVADNLYNSSPEALKRIELICGKKAEFIQLDVTEENGFDKAIRFMLSWFVRILTFRAAK
jgi:UDP-glucose 4-epimerase